MTILNFKSLWKETTFHQHPYKNIYGIFGDWEYSGSGLGVWCLTSLSTIFQLYRGIVLLVEETGVSRENHRPATNQTNVIT